MTSGTQAPLKVEELGSRGAGARVWELEADDFEAQTGHGYFCNTAGGAFTVLLPAAPSVGAEITLTDYAATWNLNNLTIDPNGQKIDGYVGTGTLSTQRASVQMVYSGADRGWLIYAAYLQSQSPVNFDVEFLVVAGGGSGSVNVNGGGGAGGGGVREGSQTVAVGIAYPVTAGGGAAGGGAGAGGAGAASIFGSITSAGGAGGTVGANGAAGGSGSGAPASGIGYAGGAGNTPATVPSQGNAGGSNVAVNPFPSGGGGGAGAVGANGVGAQSGNGGDGLVSSITGAPVTYGGGGGGAGTIQGAAPGAGGAGGGGAGGGGASNATPGTANTGGGSGGAGNDGGRTVQPGGSGVVIIAYPDTNADLASIDPGLTYTLDVVSRPGFKVYRFTAGTGVVSW